MTPHDQPLHSRAEVLRRGIAAAGLLAVGERVVPWLHTPAASATSLPRATLVSREVPLRGRALARGEDTPRFTLVGLHWQGSGSVSFRVGQGGRLGTWFEAVEHEAPDGDREGRSGQWRLGTPVWTGPVDSIEYRLEGMVTRLVAHLVNSEPGTALVPASAATPPVIHRAAWGADESIVRGPPSYASALTLAIIHHTAGRSPATPEESAAVVRAIQVYHVESNGWNDIGYNFLVDPFGQIFEGRAGGIDRNVIGAHALSFNTGSSGIALLGNFAKKALTEEARVALADLLAWRLDRAHVDPTAPVVHAASGTTLRAVSGHRDVNATECPGGKVYPELDALAQAALSIGLPKLFEPSATAEGETRRRFTARLSEPRRWRVTVTAPDGTAVATGSGRGVSVDWTWETAGLPAGQYGYTIAGPEGMLPASGTRARGPAPPPPPPEAPPRPIRPAGVPRRIPTWAWELRAWHRTPRASRGPRPRSAPQRVPSWYWPWFTWQNQLDEWVRTYGRRRSAT